MNPYKVAVIGRSGQLAQALQTAASSHAVAVFARGRPDLDVTDSHAVGSFLDETRPDVVINASAYTAVDKAEQECELAFRINAEAPLKLAELCRDRERPLVHISTDYVFDGTKHSAYVEDDAVAPLNVYGRSKVAGEDAVRGAHSLHLILRTSWVYGAYGHNFMRTMLRLGAERDQVAVVTDQHGCPTHAPDLAAAILRIVPRLAGASGDAPWGTYHLAGNGDTTWHGFAAEIFHLAAARGMRVPELRAITTADYPTPAVRPRNSCLDCDRFASTFGFRLPPWQSALEACLA
jgi:dTDP-4-dehydrorhamnose reductase